MQLAAVSPSLQPARGIRALEVGTSRIDALLSRLPDADPARVSLDVSNIGAMFQQGLTIATYHLPAAPTTAAIAQALAGAEQVTRRFHAGEPFPADDVRARLLVWRSTAAEGIAALLALGAPSPWRASAPE